MSYDPTAHGARCAECYLRTRRDGLPVPPELNERAFAIAVGEAPGATEVTEGRPFVGQSGVELQLSLATLGVRRSDLSYSNALLCKPPGDDLDLILGKFDRENTKLRKAGLAPMPSPLECCKPRLDAELSRYDNIITLGRTAASTVLGGKPSIMAIRGGPITQGNHKIMPVLHPAFVLRMRRWTRAFRADLGRAIRWFHGQSGWREPRITINPSALTLARFLEPVRPYGYDVETRPPIPGRPELCLEPLLALLGLFGVAVDDEVMVVSYRSVSGRGQFYSDAELRQIGEVLHAWGVDPRKLKIDFNGYYDGQVIEQQLGFVIAPRLDLALLHRDVEPELPHSLAYVASVYTEIPYAWKVTHAGTDAETDAEWRDYNAKDCVLTYRSAEPLQRAVEVRSQQGPVAMHHAIQRYCMGMHKNGVWVNQAKRAEWDGKLRWVALGELNKARKALKDSGFADDYVRNFNPGSTLQLRSLFFERWGFAPVAFSPKTADPSTNDETLRSLLRDPKLSVPQRAFVHALRRFRVSSKERSTYVRRMIDFRELVSPDPLTALVPLEESQDYQDFEGFADEFDEGTKHKVGRKAQIAAGTYGYVLADGRCHSHFNAHSVVTGWRLSSDGPPMQNVPRKLRELWGPQPVPGQPIRVFLSADADQGEMRIISALAGAMRLLEAFKKGADPHSINAEGFFGKGFVQSTGKDRERLRDGAKTFFYAKAYGAADDTVYEAVTSAEDAQGNLPFVNFTLRQVRSALRSWEKENPEIVRWWESEMELYRSQGFLTDPLFGFRADFLDGEDRQKILNFRSQSLLGAIVQKAAVSLVDGPAPLIPFGRYGHGTGLVLNGHDRLDFEWPVFHPRRYADPKKPNVGWCEKGCGCELERVRKMVSDAMYQRVPGLDVQFSGECKVYVGAWA